jgi:hypothetical protein
MKPCRRLEPHATVPWSPYAPPEESSSNRRPSKTIPNSEASGSYQECWTYVLDGRCAARFNRRVCAMSSTGGSAHRSDSASGLRWKNDDTSALGGVGMMKLEAVQSCVACAAVVAESFTKARACHIYMAVEVARHEVDGHPPTGRFLEGPYLHIGLIHTDLVQRRERPVHLRADLQATIVGVQQANTNIPVASGSKSERNDS